MQPTEAEAKLLSQFPGFSLDRCPGAGSYDGVGEEASLDEAVGC